MTKITHEEKQWQKFIAALDAAKAEGFEPEVLGLQGRGDDGYGLYKISVKTGYATKARKPVWWQTSSAAISRIDHDPVAYQVRVMNQGNGLPEANLAQGPVREALKHRAIKNPHLNPIVLDVLKELARRWGDNVDAMSLSISEAEMEELR